MQLSFLVVKYILFYNTSGHILTISLVICVIANQEQRLQEATLNLMTKCFSYDFNGTSVDESGEDIGIIQVKKV
jgi:hypothetical protein